MDTEGSINKDLHGAKLLQITVLDITRLQLPILLHHPPNILPPTQPLICAICDNTVAMKKVAENPAVLAKQLAQLVLKH